MVPATSDESREAWGPLILERREQLQLTQEELARVAGVSEKTVYNAEAGRTPQRATLRKLQRALGLSTDIEIAGYVIARARVGNDPHRDATALLDHLDAEERARVVWDDVLRGVYGSDNASLLEILSLLISLVPVESLRNIVLPAPPRNSAPAVYDLLDKLDMLSDGTFTPAYIRARPEDLRRLSAAADRSDLAVAALDEGSIAGEQESHHKT